MASRTYTIQNPQVNRVLDGVCYANGYTDLVDNPAGGQIPNPVSKSTYFDTVTIRFWKQSIKKYEAEIASSTAYVAASDDVEQNITLSSS